MVFLNYRLFEFSVSPRIPEGLVARKFRPSLLEYRSVTTASENRVMSQGQHPVFMVHPYSIISVAMKDEFEDEEKMGQRVPVWWTHIRPLPVSFLLFCYQRPRWGQLFYSPRVRRQKTTVLTHSTQYTGVHTRSHRGKGTSEDFQGSTTLLQ